METKEEKSFGDAVKDKINYQKKIAITFPEKVFIKLSEFAKKYTNDCFWLAIDKAIEKYYEVETKDLTTIMLMERDEQLKQHILQMEQRLTKLETPKAAPKKRKTFGKEEKENE